MQSIINIRGLLIIATLVVAFFATASPAEAVVVCGDNNLPDGWICPPRPPRDTDPTRVTFGGKTFDKCPSVRGNPDSRCVNGWLPQECGTFLGVESCRPVTPDTERSEVGKACNDAYGWKNGGADYIACYVGGQVVGALKALFSDGMFFWVLALLAHALFIVAQFFLWFGGVVLDNALYFLVVHMGDFINSVGSNGIRDAWAIIRNLGNIAIIAGFVYVGISTILQVAQYAADKFLTKLIIAALLINFSYFFAGAIIDASNFVTIQIYKSSVMQEGCKDRAGTKTTVVFGNFLGQGPAGYKPGASGEDFCSIYHAFMASVRMNSWDEITKIAQGNTAPTDSKTPAQQQASKNANLKLFLTATLASIFYFVTGFVFFSAGILIIGRFVALILLLIASPIGIAGGSIPYISDYATRWWNMLTNQAFFAPIYMLLVAISLNIIDKFIRFLGSPSASYADVTQGTFQDAINAMPLFITYFVAIGFMWASLQVARSMSATGSEYFGGIYKALDKNFGGLYGSMFNSTMKYPAKAASLVYDATLGQAGRIPIIGQPFRDVGKNLRNIPSTAPFGGQSADAQDKEAKEQKDIIRGRSPGGLIRTIPLMLEQRKRNSEVQKALKTKPEDRTEEQKLLLTNYVQGLTKEQIAAMTPKQLAEIAPFLSSAQLKDALARPDLSKEQKKQVTDARFAEYDRALAAAKVSGDYSQVARILNGMDDTERKILIAERGELRTNEKLLKLLGHKQFEAMVSDRTLFTEKQEREAREARGQALHADLTSGNDERIQGALKVMGAKDFEFRGKNEKGEPISIASAIASDPKVLPNISPAQLQKAFDAATPAEQERIIEAVQTEERKNPNTRHSAEALRGANPRAAVRDKQEEAPKPEPKPSAPQNPPTPPQK